MLKFDFQITRDAREKYKIESSFFSINGNLVIDDFDQARILSQKINHERVQTGNPDQQITAGDLYAVALMHELFHIIIRRYEVDTNLKIFSGVYDHLYERLSKNELENIFNTFLDVFPPPQVYNSNQTPQDYLNDETGGRSNREIILEELILINIENNNPAASKLKELYNDETLIQKSKYSDLIIESEKYLELESPLAKKGIKLFSLLRKPIQSNPNSIEQQLDFIRKEWGSILGEELINKILRSSDLIKEDYKLFVHHGGGEKATPPVPVYFDEEKIKYLKEQLGKGISSAEKSSLSVEEEIEQFTEDTHWMPEVVMLAKNIFVWLFQLSKKYNRELKTLNQIPDEELDTIAKWNFTSIWLIGIWERSPASKKIKQLTGNPEAASSAYSLFDYEIAGELGGESAFQNLKSRAWKRGIRIASDMVPNHTGIYSKWVINKPDYFIQSRKPPFPGYKFTGPNLSLDKRVEIRIEDKYYNRKDAAVVFERKDRLTGDTRYIYHGNDGTNMAWNDTAQLNLLIDEVKEALIQSIMHVASKTPIIRFDAAMTLAKKHFQRLWFPQPGSGGAIPSRADHAMTKEQFDTVMPTEFWRDVVERINSQMPNTLLLAEAFWLMESYFVRTLGMHRVYNSAFMHMMMKEENDKYRKLITNTLEFNPEILKRYVNFMSNPDEETAINQFGKGDKYFGVAVMMVTLPGLPMFGHGQIEGFSEKYGMEYKRAYYDETADEHLIHRHQREIFPLLKKRYLFSQVDNFEIYDFVSEKGEIDENVFAFSNKAKGETVLVLYNNSYYETSGSIRYSNSKSVPGSNGLISEPKKISELLSIKQNPKYFYEYTDHRTNLKYLISGMQVAENGFEFHLFGYQYRVCLGLKEIYDADGKYAELYFHLNGRGVYSLDEAITEMEMLPLHSAFENYFSRDNIEKLRTYISKKVDLRKKPKVIVEYPETLMDSFKSFADIFKQFFPLEDKKILTEKIIKDFNTIRKFYQLWIRLINRKSVTKWIQEINSRLPISAEIQFDIEFTKLIIFTHLDALLSSKITEMDDIANIFNDLILDKPVQNIFQKIDSSKNHSTRLDILKMLLFASQVDLDSENIKTIAVENDGKEIKNKTYLFNLISALLEKNNINSFLLLNEFDRITYFNKERFELVLNWYFLVSILKHTDDLIEDNFLNTKSVNKKTKKISSNEFEKKLTKNIKSEYLEMQRILEKTNSTGYDFNKFKKELELSINRGDK